MNASDTVRRRGTSSSWNEPSFSRIKVSIIDNSVGKDRENQREMGIDEGRHSLSLSA